MWVVKFTPRPLYPLGKSPQYLFGEGLGRPQKRSGRRGEEKTFTLLGLELRPLGRPARGQSPYRLLKELGIYEFSKRVRVETLGISMSRSNFRTKNLIWNSRLHKGIISQSKAKLVGIDTQHGCRKKKWRTLVGNRLGRDRLEKGNGSGRNISGSPYYGWIYFSSNPGNM
jgi:hypothetical protein